MTDPGANPDHLLQSARAGDAAALGRLLDLYRNYLRLVTRSVIHGALQVRIDPSDLVQETFLKAHRDFGRFVGSSEHELVAWLRRILIRNIADEAKRHRRQGRDVRRQESLEAALERSSVAVQRALAAPLTSPSARIENRERAVLLADALAMLPDHYREVFILRSLEHVPIEQIAERMGRSANAVYKLWFRAMTALKQELEGLA
jgi:RNA polymerase sigma-70 factor (ECF subfamily)